MTSFLSSILKSRLSVCLSTFCPQVVKIITFVHSNPATSHGGQWSVQWVAGGGVLGLARTGGMWLLEVWLEDCLVWFFLDACLSICFMSETQKVCSNKRKCNSNLSRLLKFYNWSNASKIR